MSDINQSSQAQPRRDDSRGQTHIVMNLKVTKLALLIDPSDQMNKNHERILPKFSIK